MTVHKDLLMIIYPFADSAGHDQSLAFCAILDWAMKVKDCGVPDISAASFFWMTTHLMQGIDLCCPHILHFHSCRQASV